MSAYNPDSQQERDAPEHQVKSGFLLDVVVAQSATILELLASENKALLIRGDAREMDRQPLAQTRISPICLPFLVLDFGLDVVDGVRRLHLEGDGLAREGLDEDLHL